MTERLYSLDVLGIEDRGKNDQLDVLRDFKENVARDDRRYEVSSRSHDIKYKRGASQEVVAERGREIVEE